MAVLAAGCLLLAAATVVWPVPGARSRRRRVLAGTPGPRRRRRSLATWGGPPSRPAQLARVAQLARAARVTRLRQATVAGPVPVRLLVLAGVALATVLGGWVAGAVAAAYGSLAARAMTVRTRQRSRASRRAELLDTVGAAAADLRAGLAAETALAGLERESSDPLLARVQAAVRLAERTGAPLAELLERIEADARSLDRSRSASAAQAAGSQATAWLLAALPAGGLALGYAIGTDPLGILLHTPIGAGCALGAVVLQVAGLGWARRITRPAPAVAIDGPPMAATEAGTP